VTIIKIEENYVHQLNG